MASGSPWRRRLGLLSLLALLAACATQTADLQRHAPAAMPRRAELAATPFFAQERYQCGPAALAIALQAAAIPATPELLLPEVYVPERQGSFAPELLAAARRHGAVAMTLPPRLEAVLAEVAAGQPVVVLLNLGLSWAPLWHFAVVIGYDLDAGEILLRSGSNARLAMAMATFEHTWARGGSWAMVALAPGRLARTVDEAGAVAALVDFERNNGPRQRRLAYAAALSRWPDNLTLLLGLGNAHYALAERTAAAEVFARAARRHPEAAPAHNNLAQVLGELGRFAEARAAAQRAIELGGPWRDQALDTLREIDARDRQHR